MTPCENRMERPSVKVDGVDLHAFQVDYFDEESFGDIAVHVDISRFHSGVGDCECGAWVCLPSEDVLEFEHDGDSTSVTFAAVQFEEQTPTLWFDRA